MNQLLESLKQHGAFFAPATPTGQITILNMNLQKIRAAMLPNEFIKFYQICGGIKLGNGYIFGPNEYKTGRTHPIPDILAINQELTNIPSMRGKTVFGEMDQKSLKEEYAKCELGDGYYYNVEADSLKKAKFIKVL